MLNPLPSSKWNYTTAAHLLNRAGFGGTPSEIEKLHKMGLKKAVSYLVDYEEIPDPVPQLDWATPDPDRVERFRALQDLNRQQRAATTDDEKAEIEKKRRELVQQQQRDQVVHIQQLRGLWLDRMATGPRPLQEKLTLFWHGHFATSVDKVRNPYFMWRQIQTFREKATGNWLDMLEAVAIDPAMLVWLDQAQSRKEHPNENFAREVMELFALGEGHYTEKDVMEAARAMTGWSLELANEAYAYHPRVHDEGEKTIFGKTGNFTGQDVLEMIVAQPQAARFITGKLWKFFGSEQADPKLLEALADQFREGGNNFKPLLRTMFSAREFYAESMIRSQVKSPVQWLVSSVRMLGRDMPPTVVSTEAIRMLGQELLRPPNVKGWDGGLSWITTNTLLSRYNEASMLVMGQGKLGASAEGQGGGQKFMAERANKAAERMGPVDVNTIAEKGQRHNKKELVALLEKRFLQGSLSEKHRGVLLDFCESCDMDDDDMRNAIRLIMSTPDYQLT